MSKSKVTPREALETHLKVEGQKVFDKVQKEKEEKKKEGGK